MPISLPPISRRRFLAGSLAAGASLLLRRPMFGAGGAGAAVDPDRFALLSDTHIAADPAKIYKDVNMAANLKQVSAEVATLDKRPAAAIVNGDLAFGTGLAEEYAQFLGLIKPIRQAGLPVHLTLGNHDHRERFWAALPADAGAAGGKRQMEDRQVLLVEAARANWYILDSLDKTNSVPGVLGEKQIAWLAGALDANAKKPALVMVHHDPIEFTKTGGEKGWALTDTPALLKVLQPRKQVKVLFFGHTHNWSVTNHDGLHFVNFPPVAYPFKPGPPSGWVDAHLGENSMTIELRCTDTKHAKHGDKHELTWRA